MEVIFVAKLCEGVQDSFNALTGYDQAEAGDLNPAFIRILRGARPVRPGDRRLDWHLDVCNRHAGCNPGEALATPLRMHDDTVG